MHIAKFSCAIAPTILALLLSGCAGKSATHTDGAAGEDEYTEDFSAYLEQDSLFAQEADTIQLSQERQFECGHLIAVAERLSAVKSPSMLIDAKLEYQKCVESCGEPRNESEREILTHYLQRAKDAYDTACSQYEVPADGVLANLKNMSAQLDQVRDRRGLVLFEEGRTGLLRKLENIHLSVERNSPAIPEIQRRARSLKNKWQAKTIEVSGE